jgi:PIN domain nuclease of toxin-antitoxin system
VRLLLDTHTLIWWDDARLSKRVTAAIQEVNLVFVSVATAWEVAIKSAPGKLVARGTVADVRADYGFSRLPTSVGHADGVRKLPPHHRDAFAPLLVAQRKPKTHYRHAPPGLQAVRRPRSVVTRRALASEPARGTSANVGSTRRSARSASAP